MSLQLEDGHSGRLERTEDLWLKVRKDHAPRLARLSLESRSLQDVLLHGEIPPGNALGTAAWFRGRFGEETSRWVLSKIPFSDLEKGV